jgi:hypothetical protein
MCRKKPMQIYHAKRKREREREVEVRSHSTRLVVAIIDLRFGVLGYLSRLGAVVAELLAKHAGHQHQVVVVHPHQVLGLPHLQKKEAVARKCKGECPAELPSMMCSLHVMRRTLATASAKSWLAVT